MPPTALTAVSYHHRAGGLAGDYQVGCQLYVAAADGELPLNLVRFGTVDAAAGGIGSPVPSRAHARASAGCVAHRTWEWYMSSVMIMTACPRLGGPGITYSAVGGSLALQG
jgi:hypothetical protein